MKRVTSSWPAFPAAIPDALARLPVAMILGFAILASMEVRAQDEPEDPLPPSADSQAVDEEEAEFRRRMELEEGGGDDRSSPSNLPDIVDVDPVEAPQDGLPPSSREHLEEQLTELIIENGRWEPSDAEREAPYEPSEAAQADPELAAEEAEAWEAMVAAYHEREQAALSGGPGSNGAGAGQGPGAGGGQGGSAGSGSGTGSGQGGGSTTEPRSSTGAGGERPPEGDPFSALEFLGGTPDAEPATGPGPAQEGPGTAAEPPPPGPEGDSSTVGAGSPWTEDSFGDDGDAGSAGDAEQTAEPAGSPETVDATPAEPEPAGFAPPSLKTDEAGESAPPSTDAVDPELLEVLFSEATTDGEPSESGPPPSDPPGAEPPREASPTSGPPPEPSLWDWLFGLFGSDDTPEPEPEPESVPEADDSAG